MVDSGQLTTQSTLYKQPGPIYWIPQLLSQPHLLTQSSGFFIAAYCILSHVTTSSQRF